MFKTLKIGYRVLGFVAILFLSALLTFSDRARSGAHNGLIACVNVLMPSLLPFTVFSLILDESGVLSEILPKKLCKVIFKKNPKEISIFIMSCIGGYPVGAKLIGKAYENGEISKKSAEDLLDFCVNASPAFVMGVVGNAMFGSKKAGYLMLAAHILAPLEICFIKRKKTSYPETQIPSDRKNSIPNIVVGATAAASESIIGICTYTIIFSTITALLPPIKNIGMAGLFIGSLEVTNAVFNTDNIYISEFFISFGGFCVITQILASSYRFSSFKKILFSRILHGLLSVFNLFVLLKLFPVSFNTFNSGSEIAFKLTSSTIILSILNVLAMFILINTIHEKKYCGKILTDLI